MKNKTIDKILVKLDEIASILKQAKLENDKCIDHDELDGLARTVLPSPITLSSTDYYNAVIRMKYSNNVLSRIVFTYKEVEAILYIFREVYRRLTSRNINITDPYKFINDGDRGAMFPGGWYNYKKNMGILQSEGDRVIYILKENGLYVYLYTSVFIVNTIVRKMHYSTTSEFNFDIWGHKEYEEAINTAIAIIKDNKK